MLFENDNVLQNVQVRLKDRRITYVWGLLRTA